MYIVHVFVYVKQESVEGFIRATVENARSSRQEPGVARFDIIQRRDDPSQFLLVEVYRTADDSLLHKETEHYKVWRDTVALMMAKPRESVTYHNIFPDERGWD